MRIVFFGTSSFAAKILSSLFKNLHSVVAVVTQPDRPRGRHLHSSFSPVKESVLALDSAMPILQPEKISTFENAQVLQSYQPDLFLVVAYGEIIKKDLLGIPRLGSFNIHASLLPKYRGAAPIQRCLMDGEKKTGIAIIAMTAQMDAGDIVASAEIPVDEEMTFGELEAALCAMACRLTNTFLVEIKLGKLTRLPQDPAQVTFAHKLHPEDERIDWNQPANAVHNRIRALSPSPGAWCPVYLGTIEKRLKIKRARVVSTSVLAIPGTIIAADKEKFFVACQQGALQLLEVQLEGKKTMPAQEFLKGVNQNFSFIT